MGLGTCWMAGTFNRSQFESAMDIADDELFPIISPIGYPAEKTGFINGVFRKASGSDRRKDWSELFFDGAFETPLTKAQAGDYAFPLEMLRLAPSAANLQPWQVHFISQSPLRSPA